MVEFMLGRTFQLLVGLVLDCLVTLMVTSGDEAVQKLAVVVLTVCMVLEVVVVIVNFFDRRDE